MCGYSKAKLPNFIYFLFSAVIFLLSLTEQKTIEEQLNYMGEVYFYLQSFELTIANIYVNLDTMPVDEKYYYFTVNYWDYKLLDSKYCFTDNDYCNNFQYLDDYKSSYRSFRTTEYFKIKTSERGGKSKLILTFTFESDLSQDEVIIRSEEKGSASYIWIILVVLAVLIAIAGVVVYVWYVRRRRLQQNVVMVQKRQLTQNQIMYNTQTVGQYQTNLQLQPVYNAYGQNPYAQAYTQNYQTNNVQNNNLPYQSGNYQANIGGYQAGNYTVDANKINMENNQNFNQGMNQNQLFNANNINQNGLNSNSELNEENTSNTVKNNMNAPTPVNN